MFNFCFKYIRMFYQLLSLIICICVCNSLNVLDSWQINITDSSYNLKKESKYILSQSGIYNTSNTHRSKRHYLCTDSFTIKK